ncbi:MAG: trypsin-like peptidase domain-containing protein [Salibacteraceae bacterium]
MKNYIGLFGAAFLGGIMSITVASKFSEGNHQNLPESNLKQEEAKAIPANFNAPYGSGMVDLSLAAEETVSEVVHVKVTQEGEEMIQYDPMEYFFNGRAHGRKFKAPDKQGSGSGVVIREDGYIVTNNHVIDGADKIEVVFNTNESYLAQVIGVDPSTDLALLKIEANGLKPVKVGDSDEIRLGEWVLAVGNPYNLNSTVTAGIVSAKARNINILQNTNGTPPLEAFIQTDAAVNPGNSGGALVNAKGELIGINSAIKSPTGSYSGYSFAIPVNIMKKVVTDIMEYGVVQRAFIGVSIRDLNAELVTEEELEITQGVYVAGLSENGAANEAGIEEGDVVTSVNDVEVKSVAELQSQIGRYTPGDKVRLEVNRDGNLKTFEVELRNSEGNTKKIELVNNALIKLGANLTEVPEKIKNDLEIEEGVFVENVGSGKIKRSGIQNGFIITHVDNQKIKNKTELNEMLKDKSGGVLFGGIYPNGTKKYYGIGL